MWLRKLILYIQHRYLLYRYDAVGIQLPDRQYTRDLLGLLHPVDFTRYSATLGKAHRFELLYPNVGAMTSRLKMMADCMYADEPIPADWLQQLPSETTLDGWLAIEDGYYVRPDEAIERFLDEALRFCDLTLLHQENKVGTQAYNWRVVRALFLNLQALAEALVPVALNSL